MSRRNKGNRGNAPRRLGGLKWNSGDYWNTAAYNSRLFKMFQNQITAMAMTRFHWVNLPKHCDERYLEWTLLTQGQATIAFPYKQKGKFYSTQAVWERGPNLYDNPVSWKSYGNNGWQFKVNKGNGVFIWDNMLRVPISDRIDIWARELADVMRTKQVNRMHQKLPFILTGLPEKEFDMTNFMKQMIGGEPVVITTKGFNGIEAKVLKTDVPFLGEELQTDYLNIWNEVYKALGINSLPFKAEREIQDEVESQSEPADLVALDSLACRQKACNELNERFEKYLDNPIQCVWRQNNISDNYNYIHNIQLRKETEDESN